MRPARLSGMVEVAKESWDYRPDLSDRKALVSAMTEIRWAIKTCKAYPFLLFIVAFVYILPAVALPSEFLTLIKKV